MSDTFDAQLAEIATKHNVTVEHVQSLAQTRGRQFGPSTFDSGLQELAGGSSPTTISDNAALLFSESLKAALNKKSEPESGGGIGSFMAEWGSNVLKVVDTPRAFVTSAVKEVGDIFDDSEGTDFSIRELFDQGTGLVGNDAIGFGEVIEEFVPGLGDVEIFGVKPLDNIAGFVGEIALDPFTYLTLGTLPLARHGTMGAVRMANAMGDASLARRLFTKGVSGASAKDLSNLTDHARLAGKIGADEVIGGGLQFTLPGTGRVANKLSGGRITPRQLQLISHESPILQYLPRTAVNKVSQAFRRSKFAGLLGGDRTALKAVLRAADSTDREWFEAFHAIDADNIARGGERLLNDTLERMWTPLERDLRKGGIDGKTAYHAMGSDVAPEGMDATLWSRLKEFGDTVRTEAGATVGDPDWIPYRENWQPSEITDEWRQYISAIRRGSESGDHLALAPFEKKAGIVAGEDFMGQRLVNASEHPLSTAAKPFTPREQAAKIIEEEVQQFGEDALQWFNDDLFEAMPQHFRTLSRRARGRIIEGRLRQVGIGVDRFVEVEDLAAAKAADMHDAGSAVLRASDERVARAEASHLAALEAGVKGTEAEQVAAAELLTAKRARIAARWDIAMADPSSEAIGLRAIAAELEADAVDARVVIDDIHVAATRNLLDLEAMAVKAERNAAILSEAEATVRHGLARLRARQTQLFGMATDAAESFDNELIDAAEFVRLIDDVDREVADLAEAIAQAEVDVARFAAPVEEIDAARKVAGENVVRAERPLRQLDDLHEMVARQALFDSRLNNLRGNYRPAIEALARALDLPKSVTAAEVDVLRQKLRRFVKAQQETLSALNVERSSVGGTQRADLKDLQTWRAETEARLNELVAQGDAVDPALAREVALTLQSLNVTEGRLSYGPQDVWFHGVGPNHSQLDLGSAVDYAERQTAEWDTFLGVHFAQDAEYASLYTNLHDSALRDPRKTAAVHINATNPAVFGSDPKLFARGQHSPDSGNFRRGTGLAQIHKEMFDSAHRNGHLRFEARNVLHGTSDDVIDRMNEMVASGMPASEVVRETMGTAVPEDGFSGLVKAGDADLEQAAILREYDEDYNDNALAMALNVGDVPDTADGFADWLADQLADAADIVDDQGVGLEGRWAHTLSDKELFDRFIYPISNGGNVIRNGVVVGDMVGFIPQSQAGFMDAVIRDFKNELRAQGHDSIVYQLRNDSGRWAVIPLDEASIEPAKQIGREGDYLGTQTAKAVDIDADPELQATMRMLNEDGAIESLPPREFLRELEEIHEMDARDYRNSGGSHSAYFESMRDLEIMREAVKKAEGGGVTDNVIEIFGKFDDASKLPGGSSLNAESASSVGRLVDTLDNPGAGRLATDVAGEVNSLRGRLAGVVRKWNKVGGPEAEAAVADIRKVLADTNEASQAINRAAAEARRLNSTAVVGRSQDLVRTITDHVAALRASRYVKVQQMFDEAGEMTHHINGMHGTVEEAAANATRGRVRAAEIQDRIRAAEGELDEAVVAAEFEELEILRRADAMDKSAAEYEAALQAEHEATMTAAGEAVNSAEARLNGSVAESLRLQAAAESAEAELVRAGGTRKTISDMVRDLDPGSRDKVIEDTLSDGWTQIGGNTLIPEELAEGLRDVGRILGHRANSKTLSGIDQITELFKSWAIASPGFHFRNAFGGIFNNTLAGVETSSYRRFHSLYSDVRKAANDGVGVDGQVAAMRGSKGAAKMRRKLGDAQAERVMGGMEEMIRNGVLTGGQTTELARAARVRETGIRGQGWNPFNPNNVITSGMRRPATHVENYLRGSLALDRLLKGGAIEDAVADVYKFHFDYDDLSAVERGVLRRVIPFYTWTRKNLPLQLEMMLTNPKVYNRVGSLKREIEREGETGDLVPKWYLERFHIRMPFEIGGNQTFIVPDLPFTELNRAVDPRQLLASSNPLLKVPLERLAGRSFFTDIPYSDSYKPLPAPWQVLMAPILPALQAGGHVETRDDGRLMMTDRNMASIEGFLPIMATARRLIPSGDDVKTQDRMWQNIANWFFGAGVRVNTKAEQTSEEFRRQFSERDDARLAASLVAK